jgi:hypothetical protein
MSKIPPNAGRSCPLGHWFVPKRMTPLGWLGLTDHVDVDVVSVLEDLLVAA